MKSLFLSMIFVFSLLCLTTTALLAEELYMITLKDGSTVVAKSYTFTDEYVEYITENGLPGYIKKDEFARIANMVGVPPGETERIREQVSKEERSRKLLLLAVAVFAILLMVLLVYLGGRKRKNGQDVTDVYYGRKEKEPTTQGHLSFEYKGNMGRISKWTIEVRSAYVEEGVLYFEGFCTTTGKRKIFRSDRVAGPVTDMSRDHHAPIDHFFVEAKEEV